MKSNIIDFIDVFIDRFNLTAGGMFAVLGVFTCQYNWLFIAFLILNIIDWVTGWAKARFFNVENSATGAKGIMKKVGYWIVLGLAFFVSVFCIELGNMIGQDLSFLNLVGFFTLGTYIINELRSIVENLMQMEVDMPPFFKKVLDILSKGLQVVAEKRTKTDKE